MDEVNKIKQDFANEIQGNVNELFEIVSKYIRRLSDLDCPEGDYVDLRNIYLVEVENRLNKYLEEEES